MRSTSSSLSEKPNRSPSWACYHSDLYETELAERLNLPRGDFAHEGSCWWTDYEHSRCSLKTCGGFGLRTFNGDVVTGRAWVMPLRRTEERTHMSSPPNAGSCPDPLCCPPPLGPACPSAST